ncbi:MAG: serine acetyltransferase [Clostridiales bacterium]|nr:serine acetyltransferase [Clostridiales bacterium]
MLSLTRFIYKCEISERTQIGPGLFIGHPYCITINPKAMIGRNCHIHKGVTIGQENRGTRKGVPTIGNEVWIGINSTIVGNITIGDDVLIAPNTYVNCNVPSHSVVFGNPCIIKQRDNATENYINNKV